MLLLKLGMAVAAFTMCVCIGYPFKPLRIWLKGKNKVVYKLSNCPFCFNYWASMIAVVYYCRSISDFSFDTIFLHWLVIVAIAHIIAERTISLIRQLEA